jgi:hypothetical protein
MHPDTARELKARILQFLHTVPPVAPQSDGAGRRPRIAVGIAPAGSGRARVAVRLETPGDRALLPELPRAARDEVELRVIGRVLAPPGAAPTASQGHVRPLRPGLSIAHCSVTAGTLGGFVRSGDRLAVLSNNHVLAASGTAAVGDPVLQPGPVDGGSAADRVAELSGFVPLRADAPNLADAAVAVLDDGVDADPSAVPGGPLSDAVVQAAEIDPDEQVEKVGRTTGHTRGRISAVEVDGVVVQYDSCVRSFDDQIEIEGLTGAFSGGGDSGSVIWRSADRAPLGLLFAGSTEGGGAGGGVTFANPLTTVLAALDVHWVPS